MLNPIPYELHTWKKSLSGIAGRVPEAVIKEMTALSTSDDPNAGKNLLPAKKPKAIAAKPTKRPPSIGKKKLTGTSGRRQRRIASLKRMTRRS